MANWLKYLIVGAITLIILPLIGSLLKFGISLAFRLGLFIFVGYVVVTLYNKFSKKKTNTQE